MQNICIHNQAGHGHEQVREVGEEEEEGLEDIQEPSVTVAQVGRADGQEVSRKIILNYKLISHWEAIDFQGN